MCNQTQQEGLHFSSLKEKKIYLIIFLFIFQCHLFQNNQLIYHQLRNIFFYDKTASCHLQYEVPCHICHIQICTVRAITFSKHKKDISEQKLVFVSPHQLVLIQNSQYLVILKHHADSHPSDVSHLSFPKGPQLLTSETSITPLYCNIICFSIQPRMLFHIETIIHSPNQISVIKNSQEDSTGKKIKCANGKTVHT